MFSIHFLEFSKIFPVYFPALIFPSNLNFSLIQMKENPNPLLDNFFVIFHSSFENHETSNPFRISDEFPDKSPTN